MSWRRFLERKRRQEQRENFVTTLVLLLLYLAVETWILLDRLYPFN